MIEFNHVTKTFNEKSKQFTALSDITLSIQDGEAFGVIGESGAGKSTLLRLINALEKPTSGSVSVNRVNVADLSKAKLRETQKQIGMIFQQFNLLNNKTVAQNVHLPLELHHYPSALTTDDVLRFVGLEDKANSYPSQLSGGQKQRVGIARALITRPDILLCDETTSALDQNTTEEIVEVLKKAHKEFKMTVVVVTHELPVIKELCQRAAVMESGEIRAVIDVSRSGEQASSKPYHERAIEVLTHD